MITSIFEACNGISIKTQIMFSNLPPFERASEYLVELTVKGFLAYDPYKQTYNLTTKKSPGIAAVNMNTTAIRIYLVPPAGINNMNSNFALYDVIDLFILQFHYHSSLLHKISIY